MRTNVRKALNQIENVLLKNNADSQDLWNILSALRGPDTEEQGLKSYTIEVRRHAFPKLTTLYTVHKTNKIPASFGWWTFNSDLRPVYSRDHFHNHIRTAQKAIKARKR